MKVSLKSVATIVFSALVLFSRFALDAHGGENVLEFSGEDSYVDLGTPAALQIPSGSPLTVEGWMYLASLSDRDTLYSKSATRPEVGPYTYIFGFRDNLFAAYDGGSWRGDFDVSHETGQWYHLAYSFDGDTMRYYFNGTHIGDSVFDFTNTEAHPVIIGGYHSDSDINGRKSDVRVWDHARSQEQIQANMNIRLTGTEPGLLGYWPLNEGEGETAYDLTIHGNHGTIVAADWITTSDLELLSFFLAHPVTGSTGFTNTNELDVISFPEYEGYTEYQITEGGAPPDSDPGSWTPTNDPPVTVDFTTPSEGATVALTAWFTNLTETVELVSATFEIVYTGVAPVAAAHASLTRYLVPGETVAVLNTGHINDGSSGGAVGGAPMDIYGLSLFCEEDTTPGDPEVTLDTAGDYDVTLTVMNEAGNTATATSVVSVVALDAHERIWTGAGADALASTDDNWSPASAPTNGVTVYFNQLDSPDCDWDRDVALSGWVQTVDYTNTVTIWTEYPDIPGGTGFTNLVITGDVVLEGGVWTHRANRGDNEAWDRLAVTVSGDFTLGAAGEIDLWGSGFAGARGPAAGHRSQRSGGKAASHGGQGGYTTAVFETPAPCYGSPTWPVTLGSGGGGSGGAGYAGGGAIKLLVHGEATVNGSIIADGRGDHNRYQGGAGGSVLIKAATVSGQGSLSAIGGWGYDTGGGGRIAVIATNGTTTGDFDISVHPGTPATSRMGTAGTVYLETAGDAQLIIDQQADELNRAAQSGLLTELLPAYEEYDPHPVIGGELEDVTLVMTNGALAGLTSSLRMGDFTWISTDSTLYLNGSFLYLKAEEPSGDFPEDYGNGTIVYDGGDIFWGDEQPQEILLLSAGPNGAISRDPDSQDDLYPFDSNVEISAHPDAGHDFVFWEGDVPEGADRTQTPLTVTMDEPREIRALFGSNAADTHTWTGDGVDTMASTASNWYPAVTPGAGAHIILNATSDKEVYWDLDVELASWRQEDGYAYGFDPVLGYWGRVVFWTEYPDLDPAGTGFTNLHITGDVTLKDGLWSHRANRGGDDAWDRIAVTIGGDFMLGSNVVVDLNGRGFAGGGRGPGGSTTGQRSSAGAAASHGGQGAWGNTGDMPPPTHGSVTHPLSLGSSGNASGGGAVRLAIDGAATIDGEILADANGASQHAGGAGGSIYLEAATFAGSGLLRTRGGSGFLPGGGGRIAVILRDSDDFADVRLQAHGHHRGHGDGPNFRSAAGTVYRRGSNISEIIVDNSLNNQTATNVYTVIPPEYEIPEPPPAIDNQLAEAALVLPPDAQAHVKLSNSLRMLNLFMHDASSSLSLFGHTLTLRSPYHDDWGHEDWVVYDGGEIIWTQRGSIFMVR